MATKTPIAIFWFRRDLRLTDNAGLYHALKSGHSVLPLFIFDRNILDDLTDKTDARVTFIHQEIARLKTELEAIGSTILVKYGDPKAVWQALLEQFEIAAVYTNHDFEPYAKVRDTEMRDLFAQKNIPFRTFKDHVIFQYDEVLKDNGEPYVVFTPYSRKWKEKLSSRFMTVANADGQRERISYFLAPYPNEKYFAGFYQTASGSMISLGDMGFEASALPLPSREVPMKVVAGYDQTRDFPALVQGTTHLGLHFRFGTISIREKARKAQKWNETYLNELIWRDFYSQIMGHFPHVADGPFRPAYKAIAWSMLLTILPPGVPAKPGIRSSMLECVNWPQQASCITACA